MSWNDDQTELLIRDGFVSVKILTGDMEFAILNKDNEIEYKKSHGLMSQHYCGSMILFSSQEIDFCVTPESNVMIYTDSLGWHYVEASKLQQATGVPDYSFNIGITQTKCLAENPPVLIPYDGSVHNVSVLGGSLLRRRNGKSIWM